MGFGSYSGQNAVATGTTSIGGSRFLYISRDATIAGTASALINAEPGVARVSSSCCIAALWWFLYDGGTDLPVDPLGLGGIDFTESGRNDRLRFIVQADTVIGLGVALYTSATESSILLTGLPASPSFVAVDLLFSDFELGSGAAGPVDFSNVGAAIVYFGFPDTRQTPLNARFDSLEAVPEPSSLALLATAVGAIAASAARQRSRGRERRTAAVRAQQAVPVCAGGARRLA